jgi:hypothetical protein
MKRFLCWLLKHDARFRHPQQERCLCRRCGHLIGRDGVDNGLYVPPPWIVDREGRVRTEKDRPVELRANKSGTVP